MTMLSLVNHRLFNGSGANQTYTIDVRTQGAWQVVVPAGVTWATVAVVGADAATPLAGNGNGTVTITVAPNQTTARRVLRINIAGVTHTLTQDYRSHD
jgi:predicted cupin superfamily sugar epimerase